MSLPFSFLFLLSIGCFIDIHHDSLIVLFFLRLGSLVCFSSFLSLANMKTPNTTMNDDGQNDESKHGGGGDQLEYDEGT